MVMDRVRDRVRDRDMGRVRDRVRLRGLAVVDPNRQIRVLSVQPIGTGRQFLQRAADWSRSLDVIQLADISSSGYWCLGLFVK